MHVHVHAYILLNTNKHAGGYFTCTFLAHSIWMLHETSPWLRHRLHASMYANTILQDKHYNNEIGLYWFVR